MPEINVDGLLFVFPEGWEVDKFDEWAFYRNQFSKQHNNIKAVDLLALECSKKTLWLIEVKDFSDNVQIFTDIVREVVMEGFLVDLDERGFLLLGVFGSRHGMALLSEVR